MLVEQAGMTDFDLVQEAKRSAAWMTFFYIVSILGMAYLTVVFLMPGTHWLLFGIGVALMMGGFLAGTVNLLNWRDVLALMFEDEEPPPDLPTGPPQRERNRPRTITINSAHDERARLEVADENNSNIIYIGEYGLRRAEWRRLTIALRDNPSSWGWSRRVLISTGIFSGLTVGNRYNDVTKSFEDARAVKVNRDGVGKIMNAHVTNQGIEALHAAAGMRVVTK
jgi:hypothetical protein